MQLNKKTVPELTENLNTFKKKFKLKDGGDYFLIGFRDGNETPLLLIARRVDL